jgi:hypothetical protein
MLTLLIGLLVFGVFGIVFMLWYINENLARIVNELIFVAKYAEKHLGERDPLA